MQFRQYTNIENDTKTRTARTIEENAVYFLIAIKAEID